MEEQIKNSFKIICGNYNIIKNQINNIAHDIKKLENVHTVYITSEQIDKLNYSTYVDDIKHQIETIKIEYNYLNDIYLMNINKFYRDLFKLYNKIVKTLITVYKENKDIIIKIWNSNEKVDNETSEFKKFKRTIKYISDTTRSSTIMVSSNKIIDEIKRKYYSSIRIYNEINNDTVFELSDIETIYGELEIRIQELSLSSELIKISLSDIKHKTDKGIIGQTLVMDLNGKLDRIKVDFNIILKILESINNIHIGISKKYKDLSTKIANEVSYDEESTDKLEKVYSKGKLESIDESKNDKGQGQVSETSDETIVNNFD